MIVVYNVLSLKTVKIEFTSQIANQNTAPLKKTLHDLKPYFLIKPKRDTKAVATHSGKL